jgi:glycosyltransferase involved in cell wall biosynthesis
VQDGVNALVFEPNDASGLAERVKVLAADPELRARLLDGGRRTAAEYPVSRYAERTVREILRAAGH